ncbi:ankyrin [Crepidotus variabilis]|uniref:Ankyrin n=1 Tax=Crepidotus variabilis TaxID=179855 RepID=A0A9P6JWV3_9AGAR|nr:ankyrin [Crepidotus variabilis]
MADTAGASPEQRLLAAARQDNVEQVEKIFEGSVNVNCTDGLGNTPLHNAAYYGSFEVLEHILSHKDCDVDPVNKVDKATPLHMAVQIEDPDVRHVIVSSLLEAGADTLLKNKKGQTAEQLLKSDDSNVGALFKKFRAQASISRDDIANVFLADDDDEGSAGSASDED